MDFKGLWIRSLDPHARVTSGNSVFLQTQITNCSQNEILCIQGEQNTGVKICCVDQTELIYENTEQYSEKVSFILEQNLQLHEQYRKLHMF